MEISLASKLNIVGEVHVTRKQYLDGSIPTGFQRTAILGVEGEIPLKNKKVKLIQLSIEEDACREVSDIGHTRIYRTDRLGMPLIETVTAPEFKNPDEVYEGGQYIRFLNRSTGRVRVAQGAGRQDVNVSCKGGTRVEVKGVSHVKWIPDVTHYECFRQWALLAIRDTLKKRVKKDKWKMGVMELDPKKFKFYFTPITDAIKRGEKLYAVNLPHFAGLLSHFCQPGRPFYDEFVNRLKVIACLERPNMATSEDIDDVVSDHVFDMVKEAFKASDKDAQIIFWAPEDDVKTALETIEERALMTFDGVPQETRKVMYDRTTIFERVLPGADRMYPDTDSAPIPLTNEYIESLRKNIPEEVADRYAQCKKWEIPQDCFNYIFTYNHYPKMKQIIEKTGASPKFVGTLFGHTLKHLHGQYGQIPFCTCRIVKLFEFLKKKNMDYAIAKRMLKVMFEDPEMEFKDILTVLGYKKMSEKALLEKAKTLAKAPFTPNRKNTKPCDKVNSIMGSLSQMGLGNMNLGKLAKEI